MGKGASKDAKSVGPIAPVPTAPGPYVDAPQVDAAHIASVVNVGDAVGDASGATNADAASAPKRDGDGDVDMKSGREADAKASSAGMTINYPRLQISPDVCM